MDDHAILQRNDRYLREFVEAFHICPFAKNCRERGQLHRAVVRGDGTQAADALVRELARLHEVSAAHVEIGLLIAPEFTQGWRAWDEVARRVADRVQQTRVETGDRLAFHVVAFHPEHPGHDDDPWRLVGLLRRSPDATLQVVRIAALEAVKGDDAAQTRYVAMEDIHKLDLLPRKGVSERIADANFATWRAHAQVLAPLLADFRKTMP